MYPGVVLVHGLSETLGESMATKLAHVLQIFQVVSVPVFIPISIPISIPAFPCFPVALQLLGTYDCNVIQRSITQYYT